MKCTEDRNFDKDVFYQRCIDIQMSMRGLTNMVDSLFGILLVHMYEESIDQILLNTLHGPMHYKKEHALITLMCKHLDVCMIRYVVVCYQVWC